MPRPAASQAREKSIRQQHGRELRAAITRIVMFPASLLPASSLQPMALLHPSFPSLSMGIGEIFAFSPDGPGFLAERIPRWGCKAQAGCFLFSQNAVYFCAQRAHAAMQERRRRHAGQKQGHGPKDCRRGRPAGGPRLLCGRSGARPAAGPGKQGHRHRGSRRDAAGALRHSGQPRGAHADGRELRRLRPAALRAGHRHAASGVGDRPGPQGF